MTVKSFLVDPKPAPPLNIPTSSKTVTVRVIDSTCRIGFPASLIVQPEIKGYEAMDNCPAFSFLITHDDRHILFDLGVAKDRGRLSETVKEKLDAGEWSLSVEKDMADILDEDKDGLGITSKDISAVIWSHHHWDHTGDISKFPKSTDLVVGPKFKEEFTGKDDSPIPAGDYEGRTFTEIDFKKQGKGFKIGRCEAIDYFGDGSFYLLSTEGHTIGHMCGFARVSTSPDSFILMGGDACHHSGEHRPSEFLPLPTSISPSPIPKYAPACPGELLHKMQRNKRADEAFFLPSDIINHDSDEATETIRKLEEFDAAENVMMIIAHDSTLLRYLTFYPETINDWYKEGLDEKTRWSFIKDFAQALES